LSDDGEHPAAALGPLSGGFAMVDHLIDVGAPDPERKTSPIIDEYEEFSLDMELAEGACYFNDQIHPIGQFVRSGGEVLRCDAPGVWVRTGETRPPKP
jgi:hypothetical protein